MKRSRFVGLCAVVGAVVMFCWAARSASALVEVAPGSDPVRDRGWPLGCAEVANLPSRIGYWVGPPFGGGEYHFLYRATDSAEFNEALAAFAKIRVPRYVRDSLVSDSGEIIFRADPRPLVLVVHDGPDQTAPFGLDEEFDWSFNWSSTVWRPVNWHRLHSDPRGTFFSDTPGYRQPVPRPRIDVYVGAGGTIIWEELEVPANVRVIDRRAEATPTGVPLGGVVRGEVFDMATGRPIGGAEVALAARGYGVDFEDIAQATADASGVVELAGLPEGQYVVRIRAEGYAPRRLGYYVNTGQSRYEFSVELARAASVRGIVTDTVGKPMAGVEVRARDTRGLDGLGYPPAISTSVTTDQGGSFELNDLPEGGFTGVRCRAPSMQQKTSITELYDVPSEALHLAMVATGIVRGRVVGPDGEAPAGDVNVFIQPPGPQRIGTWGGSMKCKEDGSFEFSGVPPGDYLLSTDPLLATEEVSATVLHVTVVAGETVEVELPDPER